MQMESGRGYLLVLLALAVVLLEGGTGVVRAQD
jgi:hypothetical protein